jgi:hypothetical protein
LFDDSGSLRPDFHFAARREIEDRLWPGAGGGSTLQADVPFRIQIDVQQADLAFALQVDPGDASLHPRMDDALLGQHQTLQQHNPVVALDPGTDFIGVQDDGLGIAGDILRQAQDLVGRDLTPVDHCSPKHQEHAHQPAFHGKPGHGASFLNAVPCLGDFVSFPRTLKCAGFIGRHERNKG